MRRHEEAYKSLHKAGRRIDDWDTVELTDIPFTYHAREKVSGRAISEEQIRRVIDGGREVHHRHATVFFVGSKEIAQDRSLADCEGIHVVCSPNAAVVITVYRNKVFTERRYQSGQCPRNRFSPRKRYGKS
ncbi:DUF4258 domain-containing protein (plasmid) [Trichlorobacter lovleyi]|uniref:DUF4258 domain-containing protein n=1 Tax=Trichlorobacter lovleyi TaxID=313985 RepID=UPI003A0FB8E9|nr:DUF4258 domain-containing protein [Trichlorobacter lovleyi]